MKKRLSTLLLVMLSFFLLSGCAMFSTLYHKQSVIENHDYDYLHSCATPPLQIPAGVSNVQVGNDYPVAGSGSYPVPARPVSEIPPGSLAAQAAQPE